jgi:hypothetical protein
MRGFVDDCRCSGSGHHVYATDGVHAFDFNGWSLESMLRDVNAAAGRSADPEWTCERLVIAEDLLSFCGRYGHRAPASFPGDVIVRADHYLDSIALE